MLLNRPKGNFNLTMVHVKQANSPSQKVFKLGASETFANTFDNQANFSKLGRYVCYYILAN